MTPEDIQRTMEFIVNHQAQLTASVGQLSTTVDKMAGKLDRTADGITSLLAIAEIHDREIAELAESVKAVDGRGRNTDERLNALIGVVEKLINDRNGKG